MRVGDAQIDLNTLISRPFRALGRYLRPLRTHSSRKARTRQVDVGQAQGHERPRRVLRQTSIEHLGKTKLTLDYCKHGTYSGGSEAMTAIKRGRFVELQSAA